MNSLDTVERDTIRINRFFPGSEEAVEILERETIRKIKVKGYSCASHSAVAPPQQAPRLVIDDALSATKVLIAKARSEASELDTVLSELLGKKKQGK